MSNKEQIQTLEGIQRAFQYFLLEGKQAACDQSTLPTIANIVVSTPKLSAAERLNVYNNAYYIRLMEFVYQDYPVLSAYLKEQGKDDIFSKLAREYVKAYPAKHFSACIFAANFSEFLKNNYPDEPAWEEFAIFEWAMKEILWAADAQTLKPEDLESIEMKEWLNQRFTFHPSVRTVQLHYNIQTLREAYNEGRPLPTLEKYDMPKTWLVWRMEQSTVYQELNTSVAIALFDALVQRHTFNEACLLLSKYMPSPKATAKFVGATLDQWVAHGLLTV